MKRSALEIHQELLTHLSERRLRKTQLAGKANLDSRLMAKHVGLLCKYGLVACHSPWYDITEAGRTFLDKYSQLVEVYP